MHLKETFPGSREIMVFKATSSREPHFVILGYDIDELDHAKIKEYLRECDWTDRGSRGWITPDIYGDNFKKGITS